VKLTEVCPARVGDLLGTGPGGDPQGDRRMPQVVDAKPLQASGPGRRTPHPGAEARGAERSTVGEGEHEAIRLDRPAGQVLLQRLDYHLSADVWKFVGGQELAGGRWSCQALGSAR
jgi:hypothetical protein